MPRCASIGVRWLDNGDVMAGLQSFQGWVWSVLVVMLVLVAGAACAPADSGQPTALVETFEYPLERRVAVYEYPPTDTYIHSLDWNPNSDSIAIGVRLKTFIYRLDDAEPQEIRGALGMRPRLAWSPDGRLLAGGDNMLWVWDGEKGEFVFEVESPGDVSYYGLPHWNPDSDMIATTLFWEDRQTQIVDLEDETVIDYNIRGLEHVSVLGWSPDGANLVAVELDGPIQIVDFPTHRITRTYRLNRPADSPLGWNPVVDRVIVRARDNTLKVCDASSGEIVASLSMYSGRAFGLAWHPQGTHVAVTGENGVWIWNTETNVAAVVQDEQAHTVDWSPDGQQLVTHVETELRIYDIPELP
jgi:WD40 repeat protein